MADDTGVTAVLIVPGRVGNGVVLTPIADTHGGPRTRH